MRNEQDMMQLFLDIAQNDSRIRLVTLEGSRTNPNGSPDPYQDYDISYFVTDMDGFKADDRWLDLFGGRVMLQKPEDMELFPPELGNWFSYLMLFADGNKADVTLIPLEETVDYFANNDGLVRVLLDKDGRVPHPVEPTDKAYWIARPTARSFDDCCNEFWIVSAYVAKGLARKELLYAVDHLHEIARPNLLRMMAWRIGAERGYTFSLGKNYKLMERYLPQPEWQKLLSTYDASSLERLREALLTCQELFRFYSRQVAEQLGYPYPDYDEAVTGYMERIYGL